LRPAALPVGVEALELVEVLGDEAGDVRVGGDGGEDVVEGGGEFRGVLREEGFDVGEPGAVQLLKVLVEEAALVVRREGRCVEARIAWKSWGGVFKASLSDAERMVSWVKTRETEEEKEEESKGEKGWMKRQRTLWSRTASTNNCPNSLSASSFPKFPLALSASLPFFIFSNLTFSSLSFKLAAARAALSSLVAGGFEVEVEGASEEVEVEGRAPDARKERCFV
jgi:hypothetical protein